MSVVRLFSRSVSFTLSHTWPVVAVAAFFIPFQFAIDYSHQQMISALDLGKKPELYLAALTPYLFINALAEMIYRSALFSLIWSKLDNIPWSLGSWRDWLRLSLWNYLSYMLLYYLLEILSLPFAMLPLLLFMLFLPYLEIVILFEHRGLRSGIREAMRLFMARPGPALALGFVRFALLGSVPFILLVSEAPQSAIFIYDYASLILEIPLIVSFLVLYSVLARDKVPEQFKDDSLLHD